MNGFMPSFQHQRFLVGLHNTSAKGNSDFIRRCKRKYGEFPEPRPTFDMFPSVEVGRTQSHVSRRKTAKRLYASVKNNQANLIVVASVCDKEKRGKRNDEKVKSFIRSVYPLPSSNIKKTKSNLRFVNEQPINNRVQTALPAKTHQNIEVETVKGVEIKRGVNGSKSMCPNTLVVRKLSSGTYKAKTREPSHIQEEATDQNSAPIMITIVNDHKTKPVLAKKPLTADKPTPALKKTLKSKKVEDLPINVVECKKSCLNPRNLDLQQRLFFESNCTLNPTFVYDNVWTTQRTMGQYQQPKNDLLEIAKRIMEKLISEYGSESRYLGITGGDLLTKDEAHQFFTNYIRSLELEAYINLAFMENTVSPTSITHDHSGKSTIIIGLPIDYRRKKIQGVLDHEIGTHFLRKFNDSMQFWSGSNRKKSGLLPHIVTEEGFASINQLVHTALDEEGKPLLFRAALNYYSAYMASQLSFADLYKDLEKYIDCPKRRFRACLRVKRGLTYTDSPGGMYKDQVYLEGAVMLLRKRKEINFEELYAGKIALEDVERLQKKIKFTGMKLPWFLKDKEKYMKALDRIAEINQID